MPRVTILRREPTVLFPRPGQAEDAVAVVFVTDAHGIGSVNLPVESYRPALPEELLDNPRYPMRPVDQAALDAERKAVNEAIGRKAAGDADSFDVP